MLGVRQNAWRLAPRSRAFLAGVVVPKRKGSSIVLLVRALQAIKVPATKRVFGIWKQQCTRCLLLTAMGQIVPYLRNRPVVLEAMQSTAVVWCRQT